VEFGAVVEVGDGPGLELADHHVAGAALDERDDAGPAFAEHGVDLPVPELGAGLDGSWTL